MSTSKSDQELIQKLHKEIKTLSNRFFSRAFDQFQRETGKGCYQAFRSDQQLLIDKKIFAFSSLPSRSSR